VLVSVSLIVAVLAANITATLVSDLIPLTATYSLTATVTLAIIIIILVVLSSGGGMTFVVGGTAPSQRALGP
jgi:hypothetical protein